MLSIEKKSLLSWIGVDPNPDKPVDLNIGGAKFPTNSRPSISLGAYPTSLPSAVAFNCSL